MFLLLIIEIYNFVMTDYLYYLCFFSYSADVNGLAVVRFCFVGGGSDGERLDNRYGSFDGFTSEFEDDMLSDQQPEELPNGHFVNPVPALSADTWGKHGDYWLVGHGDVTSPFCGNFTRKKLYGCLNVEKHNHVMLDGRSFKGKIYVKKAFMTCDKPECPVCYKDGWAVREGHKIADRLASVASKFGLVEHIIHSVPVQDYHLSMDEIKKKVLKHCKELGIIGGSIIPHAFRYKKFFGWYWSPHFHILGFVFGGYGCRSCKRKSNCDPNCKGFDSRAWKHYQKTKYYTKVKGKRITVAGTAWYQLSHCSYKVNNKKRNNVVSWFGICSYRKLRFTPVVRKSFCKICGDEIVPVKYKGALALGQLKGEGRRGCDLFLPLVEDGVEVWELRRVRRKSSAIARVDFSKEAVDRFRSETLVEMNRQFDAYKKVEDAFQSRCFGCGNRVLHNQSHTYVGGKLFHLHCARELELGRKPVSQ